MAAMLLFLLTACASGPSQEATAPAPKPPPPPGAPAGPAQSAPTWATLPPNPPGDASRVCLWVFWTQNQELMREMQAELGQGRPFQSAALDLVRNNKGFATTHADCLPRRDLPPAMTQAVKDLRLGQVSPPFELNNGQALAMLTSDVFRRQAQQLYQQGKYRQAMQPLSLDLELHPAAAGSWHLMALCRAAVGDQAGALKAYDQALEWTPGDPAVINDKAALLSAMGQGDQAVVLFRRALAAAPDNPVYMNNLAWAMVQNKHDLNEALALAQKAVKLAPDNPAVWDTLGLVQQARGDHAGAVVSFHHALRLDPQAAGAKSRMTASLLQLSPAQVTRLSASGVRLPPAPAPAPEPKPQAKPQPVASAKPQPTPMPPPRIRSQSPRAPGRAAAQEPAYGQGGLGLEPGARPVGHARARSPGASFGSFGFRAGSNPADGTPDAGPGRGRPAPRARANSGAGSTAQGQA